jgi:mannose-6-phosphate isomerase-like protein (cupin superfamily)
MKSVPLAPSTENFFTLQSLPFSEAGVIRLEEGKATSDSPECHADKNQTLLLIEGELVVEVENAGQKIHAGATLTVPAGVKHRFINCGRIAALAFTVMV